MSFLDELLRGIQRDAREFADRAALRAIQGGSSIQAATVLDKSAGTFVWTTDVTTPHDGGAVVASSSGRTGAWKRVYDGAVSVRWFGAKGDGVTDDTAAIQAAINFAGSSVTNPGAIVQLESLTYKVTAPLVIDKSALQHSITLRGGTGSPRTNEGGGTVLRWTTNDVSKAVIKLWSSQSAIENLSVVCATGAQARCAIDCTKPAGAYNFSRNSFKHLLLMSENTGSPGMLYGIVMGDKSQGDVTWPDNGECMTFDHVFCYALAQAGVFLINESGEEMLHTYDRCVFYACHYGIWTRGSSFVARDCVFSALTTAIYQKNSYGMNTVHNPDCEFVQRFYDHEGPGASNSPPFILIGGRHELSGMNADGVYFHFGSGGPITMVGGHFSGDVNHNFKIKCTIASGLPWSINTIGVAFPEVTDPYGIVVSDSLSTNWARIGCSYNVSGSFSPVADTARDDALVGSNTVYTEVAAALGGNLVFCCSSDVGVVKKQGELGNSGVFTWTDGVGSKVLTAISDGTNTYRPDYLRDGSMFNRVPVIQSKQSTSAALDTGGDLASNLVAAGTRPYMFWVGRMRSVDATGRILEFQRSGSAAFDLSIVLISGTAFRAYCTNSGNVSVDHGLTPDTEPHFFEVWMDAATGLHFSIDGSDVANGAATAGLDHAIKRAAVGAISFSAQPTYSSHALIGLCTAKPSAGERTALAKIVKRAYGLVF